MPADFQLHKKPLTVWIGFDPREAHAFAIARASLIANLTGPVPIRGLVLHDLIERKFYSRPTEIRNGKLYDVISEHEMATEFAVSRFLVPMLMRQKAKGGPAGWGLFMDCDMLVRTNLMRLFELADPSKAVMVVKHDHRPTETTKMDGQVQSQYPRKNWSSVMLFNADHPANDALTIDLVNSVPGRDLHRFCWLKDDDIGELPVSWNWLAGHSDPEINPDIVHFTDGVPTMPGYENAPYADEWKKALTRWAA